MMDVAVVKNGTIVNIIVANEPDNQNTFPLPDGAKIGDDYPGIVTLEALQEENKLLKAQLQAQSDRADFIEDCIAEMAMAVYGEV